MTWKTIASATLLWSLCAGLLRLAHADILLGELLALVLGSLVLLLVLSMRHGISSWLRPGFLGQVLAWSATFGVTSLLVGTLLSSSPFATVTLMLAPFQAVLFVSVKTLRRCSPRSDSSDP